MKLRKRWNILDNAETVKGKRICGYVSVLKKTPQGPDDITIFEVVNG